MEQEERWAEAELGGAELDDCRRNRRVVDLAQTLARHPAAALPEASETAARLQAAQRFFGNPAVRPAAVLAPHTGATAGRMAATPVVLAVQDTTELDLTAFATMTGTGPLLRRAQRGLLVHTTLAVTPPTATTTAVPLGVLDQQVWARDLARRGQVAQRRRRPLADKESHKWLTGLAAVERLVQRTPTLATTTVVVVGDRESDLYDLFLAPRPATVHLLVRAAQTRRLADQATTLWPAVAAAPPLTTTTVAVPARPGRPARVATVAVRVQPVTLRPPRSRDAEHLPVVALWAVWVREPDPPPGVAALDWRLLTTWPVAAAATALAVVTWYTGRWTIEDWHRVLKTGCAIEQRQFDRAEDFIRCLSLYSIIAWRVLAATRLARAQPALPASVLLATAEWQALCCVRDHTATPPATPPTLAEAVTYLAQRGGFQPRPGRVPGAQTLWRGLAWLAGATDAYQALTAVPHPSLTSLSPPVPL